MGYRSDVAYVVKFHSDTEPEKAFADYVAFTKWVKHDHVTQDAGGNLIHSYNEEDESLKIHSKDLMVSFSAEDESLKIHSKDLMVSFSADSVRWYESYVDVRWHDQLLEKVRTYTTGNFRFVRIGEEYEDIEVNTHCPTYWDMDEYVGVNRAIELHPPHESEDNEGEKDEPM